MKRILLCALCAVLVFSCMLPARAERQIPAALRFQQKVTRRRDDSGRMITVIVPYTSQKSVNDEITALIRSMEKRGASKVSPSGRSKIFNRGDFGSYITRVGDRWMSFLTVGRVANNGVQTWLSADARVYNMETGKRVWLDNIIDASIGGWELLASEVHAQLSALFPGEEADPEALEALCTPKGLATAGFTISPGHLSLIWPASVLYPSHAPGLLRVEIYLPLLRYMLTREALDEMNCDGYALVALTYDDGPARGTSDLLIDELLIAGAQATFFLIGHNASKNQSIVRREYDAGFSVQSHTWSHAISLLGTKEMPPAKLWSEKKYFDEFLSGLVGTAPVMMRAPGGFESFFLEAGIDLPLIHWSLISGDADRANLQDDGPVYRHVGNAQDGDIVLLHDAYSLSPHAAREYLPKLEKRSILLVTVNDLCLLRNVSLNPGSVILNGYLNRNK